MPVKRRASKAISHRIMPEAVAAFRAGDFHGLHRALGLKPWEPSPLPQDVDALGVYQGPPPEWMRGGQIEGWEKAQKLQRQLMAAAEGEG